MKRKFLITIASSSNVINLIYKYYYQFVMSKKYVKAALLTIRKLCLYIIYIAHRFFHFNVSRERQISDVCEKKNNHFDDCRRLSRIII